MKKYWIYLLLLALLCGCTAEPPVETQPVETQPQATEDHAIRESLTAGKPVEASLPEQLVGTSVCRLKMLPLTAAVQRFAFVQVEGELWIFVTQCVKEKTYLTRFVYDPQTKIATPKEITPLENYGHGESLEVTLRNGKVCVYIGSRAKHAFTSYYWSTTITRFSYENGKLSDVKELTDLHCATADGAPLHENATPYRINFALNEKADMLALYVQCDTNHSRKNVKHYMCAYKLSQIDAMLDAAQDTASLKNCTEALVHAPEEITVGLIQVYRSYQGMDMNDAGEVLISSGGAGEAPGYKRLGWTEDGFGMKQQSVVNNIYSMRHEMQDWVAVEGYPETECIRYYNGYYYSCFNPGGDLRNTQTELFLLSGA